MGLIDFHVLFSQPLCLRLQIRLKMQKLFKFYNIFSILYIFSNVYIVFMHTQLSLACSCRPNIQIDQAFLCQDVAQVRSNVKNKYPLDTLYFHFSAKLPDSYLWPRFKGFEVKSHMTVKAHKFFQYTALHEKKIAKLRKIITLVIQFHYSAYTAVSQHGRNSSTVRQIDRQTDTSKSSKSTQHANIGI